MKTISTLFLFLALGLTTTVSRQADAHVGWWGWGGWGPAVTAWGDHLRFVGLANYLNAKANYENALAAKEWVKARGLLRVVRHMEIQYRRIERRQYEIDRARRRIEDAAKGLNAILLGKASKARGLAYFMTLPGFGQLPTIKALDHVGPFAADAFIATTAKYPAEAFPGGTALEFLVWLRAHYFDVVVDTDATTLTPWQILVNVRQEILNQISTTDEVAADEATKVAAMLQNLN